MTTEYDECTDLESRKREWHMTGNKGVMMNSIYQPWLMCNFEQDESREKFLRAGWKNAMLSYCILPWPCYNSLDLCLLSMVLPSIEVFIVIKIDCTDLLLACHKTLHPFNLEDITEGICGNNLCIVVAVVLANIHLSGGRDNAAYKLASTLSADTGSDEPASVFSAQSSLIMSTWSTLSSTTIVDIGTEPREVTDSIAANIESMINKMKIQQPAKAHHWYKSCHHDCHSLLASVNDLCPLLPLQLPSFILKTEVFSFFALHTDPVINNFSMVIAFWLICCSSGWLKRWLWWFFTFWKHFPRILRVASFGQHINQLHWCMLVFRLYQEGYHLCQFTISSVRLRSSGAVSSNIAAC